MLEVGHVGGGEREFLGLLLLFVFCLFPFRWEGGANDDAVPPESCGVVVVVVVHSLAPFHV